MSVFPQIFPVFLTDFFFFFFLGQVCRFLFDVFWGFLAVWQPEQSTAHFYTFSGITANPTLVDYTELVP